MGTRLTGIPRATWPAWFGSTRRSVRATRRFWPQRRGGDRANMLYRQPSDRGTIVLWFTPLTDAAAETVAGAEVYTAAAVSGAADPRRPAISMAASPASRPKRLGPWLLMLWHIMFAAAIVLLGVFGCLAQLLWLRAGCSRPVARELLARCLGAGPSEHGACAAGCHRVPAPLTALAGRWRESADASGHGRRHRHTALGTAITFWGCCYIVATIQRPSGISACCGCFMGVKPIS